jgi:hypothetical protein
MRLGLTRTSIANVEDVRQVVAGNRFDDLQRMLRYEEAHPSPALRVWTLNGRFSTGIRQGDIAQRIADQVESAAAESASGFDDAELEAAVYQSIWDLVTTMADPGKSRIPRDVRRGLRRLRRGR